MIDFLQIDNKTVQCTIDSDIFNERVITKSLYWLSENYNLYQELSGKLFKIRIELKTGFFMQSNIDELKSHLNQNLIDFKTRDIINQETKSIREILLIKAFANNDEFEDFNLITNEQI
jgi:His-Xaa-Ser system protein HxsD